MTTASSKDLYSELKQEQFVPIQLPLYSSAARSAEPSNPGPSTEEYEFRLNMPSFAEDEFRENQGADKSVYALVMMIELLIIVLR